MEYSAGCAIPYISRVDAGTIELIRQLGVEVASSGDLVQRFAAVWHDAEILTHQAASVKLYRIKDRAFEAVARRMRDGVSTTEYDIQQLMVEWFEEEGLISDSEPNVSAAGNAGNPHYLPTAGVVADDPRRRDRAARSLGQAESAWRGVCGHHVGGLHRSPRCPNG